jgi:predicted small lipoprotein YifL
MIVPFRASGRALLTASLLVLALTACGRRGPLEAPLDPATAAQQRQREEIRRQRQGGAPGTPAGGAVAQRSEGTSPTPDEDDVDELPSNIAPTPIPTPTGGRKRGVLIPKTPFILDPLL